MTHLDLYDRYFEKLVKCLPMDDVHFIAHLRTSRLLPGYTESKIKTLSTSSEKASFFLSHVIRPPLALDDVSYFHQLLSIMHDCGYNHVQKLSFKINQDMNINPGILMYIVKYIQQIYSLISKNQALLLIIILRRYTLHNPISLGTLVPNSRD